MSEENLEQPIEPTPPASSDAQASGPSQPERVNRPAEGARIVTPDEVLEGNLGGSVGAGDFLGLDTELTAAMAQSDLELSAAPGATCDQPAELEPSSELAPGDLLAAPDAEAQSPDDEQAEYDDEFDGEYADEEFDDEFDEEFEYSAPAGLGKFRLVAAFGGGLLLVFGVTMGPQLLSKFSGETPVDVAQAPAPQAQAPSQPRPIEAQTPAIDSQIPSQVAQPIAPEQPLENLANAEPIAGQSEPETQLPEALLPDATNQGQTGAEGLRPEVLGFGSDILSALTKDTGASGAAGTRVAVLDNAFPDFTKGFDWAERGSLDMVWREETIPMEAVHAPARTMMPFVGMVRATLTNGASLDGKLHAMGEGSIWLRDVSNGGLLGLDGNLVSSLERLAVEAGASLSQPDAGSTALREKVRVKLKGGTIAGTLVSREGEWVSIRTASGGIIRLQNPDLEVVTQERVILIRD